MTTVSPAADSKTDRKQGWFRVLVDFVTGRSHGKVKPWPKVMFTSKTEEQGTASQYILGRYRGEIDVTIVHRIAAVQNDYGTYDLHIQILEPSEETQYKRRGMSGDDAAGTLLLNEIQKAERHGGITDVDSWIKTAAKSKPRGHILRELNDRGLLESELEDLRRSGNLPRPPQLDPIKANPGPRR